MEKKRKNGNKFVLGIIILIVFGFFIYSYLSKGFFYSVVNLNQDVLIETLSSLGAFSFLAYILLIITGVIFAPIHPFIFYVTGGIVFGPYISWGLTIIGVAIGSSIAFKLSQKYGREFVDKHVSKKHTEKFDKLSEKYGSIAIFLLRLNPLTSSDVWSYIAGLTKIKFWRFLGYTLLGLAPAIFVQVYFGKEVGDNPVLFKIFVGIAIVYFTILALGLIYFFFIRRKDKKTENKDNKNNQKKK